MVARTTSIFENTFLVLRDVLSAWNGIPSWKADNIQGTIILVVHPVTGFSEAFCIGEAH